MPTHGNVCKTSGRDVSVLPGTEPALSSASLRGDSLGTTPNMASAGQTNFVVRRFHDTKVKLRFISYILCPY